MTSHEPRRQIKTRAHGLVKAIDGSTTYSSSIGYSATQRCSRITQKCWEWLSWMTDSLVCWDNTIQRFSSKTAQFFFYLISFQSIRLWSMSDFISRLAVPRRWTALICLKSRSRAIADHLGVQLHCNKTISLKKKINRQQKNVYFYILYSLLRSQNKMATSWSLSLAYQSLPQAFIVLCLYKIH